MMTATMTSETVRAMTKAAGLKVRVRDLGPKFRVCGDKPELLQAWALLVVAGCTNVIGTTEGADFNGSRELLAYKPGAIRRV